MCVCAWGVLLQSYARHGGLIRLVCADGLFSVITMLFIRFHHVSPFFSCLWHLLSFSWLITGGGCDCSRVVIASQVCWYGDVMDLLLMSFFFCLFVLEVDCQKCSALMTVAVSRQSFCSAVTSLTLQVSSVVGILRCISLPNCITLKDPWNLKTNFKC